MKTADSAVCRICGNGHLNCHVKKTIAEYKGVEGELDLTYSVCDYCSSEQAAGTQLRTNKRAMIEFKKSVDGLLTGKEVRAIRERLRLSQADAAKVFGGGPVAFSKYESGDVNQSEGMDKLIRLAAELPIAFEYLARQAGIEKTITATDWENAEDWKPRSAPQRRPKLRIIGSKISSENPRYEAA